MSNREALLGGVTADLAFDSVKGGNTGQGFRGDCRGTALGEFVKLARDMGPAEAEGTIRNFVRSGG